jgi:starch phosphorylase
MRFQLLPRDLPDALAPLGELARDLRWTWSHAADDLWRHLDPDGWARSENPWVLLQDIPQARLDEAAANPSFVRELQRLAEAHRHYLARTAWLDSEHPGAPLRCVAYFCMEFGLGGALPLYAGGLGVLAGDYLKAASDLGVPVVGIGLLYQEGYFRQMLDAQGNQREVFPYNDPISLPVQPVLAPDGRWLHAVIDFPGRPLYLRLWEARVGRARLYLLDSNDALNSPPDRGITSQLYGGGTDVRLLQEIVLGIGGWRALEALGIEVDICHLNEGHAAFAVIERARSFMERTGVSFREAFWATRAGNVFTTHTSVPVGFDRYGSDIVDRYRAYFEGYAVQLGVSLEELRSLGQASAGDASEPFNMAYLALRGSVVTNAVSRAHEGVSRHLFSGLFPRRPEREVPITHVTNGVHMPTWDSEYVDGLWEAACGKDRWLTPDERATCFIASVPDDQLWTCRGRARQALVERVRSHLRWQFGLRGVPEGEAALAASVFDPNVLTLGFARRFTSYKRPNLLLRDPERLVRLLTDPRHPVQLVVAGKADPDDQDGKSMIRSWAAFVKRPDVRRHAVFLEDYDIALAMELVRGVDVWLNTPRRPWEACGTSGMKVLVNGGLNVSVLDGWWAEAWRPEIGWTIGAGEGGSEASSDEEDASQLYALLEREVVPEFYSRDAAGIPTAWVARMRASMTSLTWRFSSNRMLRDYVEQVYLPLVPLLRERTGNGGLRGRELDRWHSGVERAWHTAHFGNVTSRDEAGRRLLTAQVYLGDLDPQAIRVEVYAEPAAPGGAAFLAGMSRTGAIPGAVNGGLYEAPIPADRPVSDFTPRIVPFHPLARVPAESPLVCWQR